MADELIELKNSSYARGRKYAVDAEQIMYNLRLILEKSGTGYTQDIIEATGQVYNPLLQNQFINAITQLILAANYFKDIGTTNNIVLAPYTTAYGTPTQYIQNMVVKFRPASVNTGPTTISFNGLSPVALVTDTFDDLSDGSLSNVSDFTAQYNEEHNAFVLTASIEDSGSLALQEIRHVVESAGLVFSTALEQQLNQAIAIYTLQQTYKCTSSETNIANNNYVLEPINEFIQTPLLTDGMVIRFRPTFANTLVNPTVQIYGMTRCSLFAADGDTLPEGSISSNFDAVIKYDNGSFYLVSNGLSSLKLQEGPVVTQISNDASLTNGSKASLTTEFAVKSYVDAKVGATKSYAVSSGESDSYGRAAFFSGIGENTLTVLAGVEDAPSYINLADSSNVEASPARSPEVDPEDPETTITFDITNCFDGDNSTYYETAARGSDVAGHYNEETQEYDVWPNYIGVTGISCTNSITKVRLLGNDPTTMPRKVFFRYFVESVGEWQDVGTEIYQTIDEYGTPVTKVKRDVFPVSFNSGEFTDINVNIIPYVDATNPDLGIDEFSTYKIRCYAVDYTNQDNGWQLVEFQFCIESESISPLVLTYADGTSEVLTDKTLVSTGDLTESSGVVLKSYGDDFFIINSSNYVESYTEPTPEVGTYWIKLGGERVITYTYNEDDDSNIIREEVNVLKVGSIDFNTSTSLITDLHPSAFNGEFTDSNITLTSPTIINHNIGSLNTVRMFITCVGSDGGYVNGDTIELTTQAILVSVSSMARATTTVSDTSISYSPLVIGEDTYNIASSPNPHTHTATTTINNLSTVAQGIRSVSSGLYDALLRYNALILPNKNTGELFTANTSAWKLSVKCSRSF